jgi:hypothetical protein
MRKLLGSSIDMAKGRRRRTAEKFGGSLFCKGGKEIPRKAKRFPDAENIIT